MITINFKGKDINVLEHMSEVKAVDSDNQYIFGRFYNKKQLFKTMLGDDFFSDTDEIVSEHNRLDPDEEDNYGPICGRYVVVNSRIGDYAISIYKLEQLDVDEDSIDDILSDLDWNSFFLKADDGQIYFFEVHVD